MISSELPKPGEAYINPNQAERQRLLGQITLWAIIGPTASGKTTLMNELEKVYPEEFVKVVGYTNREIRANETNGVDYNFVSTKQMADMHAEGQFLQLECLPSGYIYGTGFDSYPKNKINMFAVAAQAMPNFRIYGFKNIVPLFIAPDDDIRWRERLKNQGITEKELPKRIEEAITSYEFALCDGQVRFILSDKIQDAVNRLIEFKQTGKISDESTAHVAIKSNLKKLKNSK